MVDSAEEGFGQLQLRQPRPALQYGGEVFLDREGCDDGRNQLAGEAVLEAFGVLLAQRPDRPGQWLLTGEPRCGRVGDRRGGGRWPGQLGRLPYGPADWYSTPACETNNVT
ncbi:hypothetical protein [Streptomyces sp. NPDC085540]|uniref:hypothetical protein n=1 Tax=Streptomyces sp. NPDC085540 TaxID=3365730 RepID=UPI0037D0B514